MKRGRAQGLQDCGPGICRRRWRTRGLALCATEPLGNGLSRSGSEAQGLGPLQGSLVGLFDQRLYRQPSDVFLVPDDRCYVGAALDLPIEPLQRIG